MTAPFWFGNMDPQPAGETWILTFTEDEKYGVSWRHWICRRCKRRGISPGGQGAVGVLLRYGEAMSDSQQWLHDKIAHHTILLELLTHCDPVARVTCPICIHASPRSQELCGCFGQRTVAEAMAFHRAELAVLGMPTVAKVSA